MSAWKHVCDPFETKEGWYCGDENCRRPMTPPKKDEGKVPTDGEILDDWIKTPFSHKYKQIGEFYVSNHSILELMAQARLAGREEGAAEQRERDAQIAENPYSNLVQVIGREEPSRVGNKIAQALRAQRNDTETTPKAEEGEK